MEPRRGLSLCRLLPPLVAALAVVALASSVDVRAASDPDLLPRVTLIGDSIATAIAYEQGARATLAGGVDLRLEVAACRRVGQSSCPYGGERPPTVLELVPSLGSELGATVIVAVGYNDFEDAYAENVEDALVALRRASVTRVLWVTLRAERHPYLVMNDAIRAAAARHPELTVVDWNVYSRSHPDWFHEDGLHLNAEGARAMATLLHDALVTLGVPAAAPQPPAPPAVRVAVTRLPVGRAERPYTARLRALGGVRPYRWSPVAGTIPRNLHLSPSGLLSGVPATRGVSTVVVRVTDARGASATRRLDLRVRA